MSLSLVPFHARSIRIDKASIVIYACLWGSNDVAGFWYVNLSSFINFSMLNLLVQGFGGLVTTRFLMGIAEAGVFPGCKFLDESGCR